MSTRISTNSSIRCVVGSSVLACLVLPLPAVVNHRAPRSRPSWQDPNSVTLNWDIWWLRNLLVSRLYNPQLSIAAIVDTAAAVEAHPTTGPTLRAANIRIAPMDAYTQPGSRTAQLMANGPGFFQCFFAAYMPDHHCATKPASCAGPRGGSAKSSACSPGFAFNRTWPMPRAWTMC